MNADKMSIEDLLSDESFINYCKGTSPEDIVFWENYIKVNPKRGLLVEHAKEKYIQAMTSAFEKKKIIINDFLSTWVTPISS